MVSRVFIAHALIQFEHNSDRMYKGHPFVLLINYVNQSNTEM